MSETPKTTSPTSPEPRARCLRPADERCECAPGLGHDCAYFRSPAEVSAIQAEADAVTPEIAPAPYDRAMAAVTQPGFYPAYINATREANGDVKVTLRAKADWQTREMGKTVDVTFTRAEWGQFLSNAVLI